MRLGSRRRLVALSAALCLAVVLAPTGSARAAARPRVDYYVSVGDSYAAGYQPVASALKHRDAHGFAYQVVTLARTRGDDFELANFACDGATTATIIGQVGCSLPAPGPDTASYPTQTQAAAAEGFLERHPGQIGLITVSIGGNDILGCSAASILISCMTEVLTEVRSNLDVLLAGLRRAAGPGVPIVGLTYPDVFLGLYTEAGGAQKSLAELSVVAFRTLLNPALRAAYGAYGGSFVDVTQAKGAYTPLSETTSDASYGIVPVAVADVCSLTYECRLQDVHPTTQGYNVIAHLIVGQLPKRR
jgi:lysophospholipase L1-like esterase